MNVRFKEFGFADSEQIPRHLVHHAVTISLPSAMDHGLEPVEVHIEQGLMVPVQAGGNSRGLVIRDDGAILFVEHADPRDPASPLQTRFIEDVPYDVRAEVSHIMRRALQADPSLEGIWTGIRDAWMRRFPVPGRETGFQAAGEFLTAENAWKGVGNLVLRLIEHRLEKISAPSSLRIKIVVQREADFKRGWDGEECVADEVLLQAVVKDGVEMYLRRKLFHKLQQVLRDPMFHPRSTFRLYYEARAAQTIKLVVVEPGAGAAPAVSAGIELGDDASSLTFKKENI